MIGARLYRCARFPATWMSFALLTAWGVWALITFKPPPAEAAAGALILLALGTSWVAFFVAHASFVEQRILMSVLSAERRQETELATALGALGLAQGEAQLRALQQGIASLLKVIQLRFAPTELAFARYSAAAEAVRHACLGNLEEMRVAAQSIEVAGSSEEARTGIESPVRSQVRQEQRERIDALLGANEAALDAMAGTAAALARTPTNSRQLDSGAAVADLERLARTTARYGAQGQRGLE